MAGRLGAAQAMCYSDYYKQHHEWHANLIPGNGSSYGQGMMAYPGYYYSGVPQRQVSNDVATSKLGKDTAVINHVQSSSVLAPVSLPKISTVYPFDQDDALSQSPQTTTPPTSVHEPTPVKQSSPSLPGP